MMKIHNIVGLFTLIFVLSGCDLAIQDEYYKNKELLNDGMSIEDYYIPSGIEFNVYKGLNHDSQIDVSEYFYVRFGCPDMTVFDNCSSVNYGKSIDSSGVKFHTAESIIDDVEQPTIITTTIDLTFYALKDNDLSIYSTVLLENEFGDIIEEGQTGINFASGVAISGTLENKSSNGDIHILEYTYRYETIDILFLVRVKQFDKDDNLLKETAITSAEILDKIKLEDDTAYYFIIENYVDELGNLYQERIYNNALEPFYYLYKYCNEDGFLNGDRLSIEIPINQNGMYYASAE